MRTPGPREHQAAPAGVVRVQTAAKDPRTAGAWKARASWSGVGMAQADSTTRVETELAVETGRHLGPRNRMRETPLGPEPA